eukprot:1735340-Prymnesium_polylepis.1
MATDTSRLVDCESAALAEWAAQQVSAASPPECKSHPSACGLDRKLLRTVRRADACATCAQVATEGVSECPAAVADHLRAAVPEELLWRAPSDD